jgi:hypothetical protein
VPRRNDTVQEHIADVYRQLQLGRVLKPRSVTIIGGCDTWSLEQSVRITSTPVSATHRARKYRILPHRNIWAHWFRTSAIGKKSGQSSASGETPTPP